MTQLFLGSGRPSCLLWVPVLATLALMCSAALLTGCGGSGSTVGSVHHGPNRDLAAITPIVHLSATQDGEHIQLHCRVTLPGQYTLGSNPDGSIEVGKVHLKWGTSTSGPWESLGSDVASGASCQNIALKDNPAADVVDGHVRRKVATPGSDGEPVYFQAQFVPGGNIKAYQNGVLTNQQLNSAANTDPVSIVRGEEPANLPPTISVSGPESVESGAVAPLTVEVNDPENDTLAFLCSYTGAEGGSFDESGLPAELVFNAPGVESDTAVSVTVTVNDTAGNTASASWTLTVVAPPAPNEPPTADLSVDTATGFTPLTVGFNASASSDSDGTVESYDWDFDGDGEYDLLDGGAEVQHTYNSGGKFNAAVRVTDDDGAQATASQQVWSQGWRSLTVDSNGLMAGRWSSMALINGKPAIGYTATGGLRYSYSSEIDGSSGWSTVPVDSVSAGFAGLAQVNGKPAMCYYNGETHDLKYAYSSMEDGSGGWTSITIDSAGTVGRFCSLATINGKPAISYVYEPDASQKVLKFAFSSSADGSSGWTIVTVASGQFFHAQETSLAEIDGKPAIGFRSHSVGLQYAYSSSSDGSSGWSLLTVDNGQTGLFPHLAVVDGKPAISYYDSGNGDLKYAFSSINDGSSGWSKITVDANGTVGYYPRIAIVDGKPAIAYAGAGGVKYAHSSTPNGSGGWTAMTIKSGTALAYTTLVATNGRPAVSFYDDNIRDLLFAWVE